ncbi:cytochrome c oxidase assembly protein [Luteimonas dalianensis]|uniref:cytochrome c oxidase assembly protein n=1 Tax=Luteimonas dalianensis TaxID=1148196 RepID=UPI003BF28AE5
MRRTVPIAIAGLLALAPEAQALPRITAAACFAGDAPPALWQAWTLSPLLLGPLVLLVLYVAGVARLWRQAGVGRGIPVAAAGALLAGALVFFLATAWPIDAYAGWSLAAHVGQHMLLLAVAPPLLLAGRPLAGIAHALPRGWSQRLHAWAAPVHGWLADRLGLATVAHAGVLVVWHVPAAIAVALADPLLHLAMHAAFALAGMWFWIAVWRRIREPEAGVAPALVALVTVTVVMGFTGALLTFAPRILYPAYALRAPLLGLDPLADQQLAGLLMWVPSCLPYLAGGLWLLVHGFERLRRQHGGAAAGGAP